MNMAKVIAWLFLPILVALIACHEAYAQSYPSKPIRVIVPWPPGGPASTYARVVAEPIGKYIGQPLVLESRPGASGTIGAAIVATSKPDGYTMLFACQTDQVVAPVSMKISYDPVRDFVPIALIAEAPFVFVASPSLGVKSVEDFLSKAKTGSLVYGSPGAASVAHFLGEHFKRVAGIDMLHVPYKGQGDLLPDLLAGRVQASFMMQSTVGEHLRAGKLTAVFVTSDRRLDALPSVPTASESKLRDLQAYFWCGLVAPSGTPQWAIDTLARAVKAIQEKHEVRESMKATGATFVASSPVLFATLLKSQRERWAEIVRSTGIRGE